MPYLNVKLSVPESADLTKNVAAVLTDITAEVLGKSPDLTVVVIDYVQPQYWFISGASLLDQNGDVPFIVEG